VNLSSIGTALRANSGAPVDLGVTGRAVAERGAGFNHHLVNLIDHEHLQQIIDDGEPMPAPSTRRRPRLVSKLINRYLSEVPLTRH
jgi:hypothetical protein